MQIDDLSSSVYAPGLHHGVQTRAVGWLGHSVPATGTMSSLAIRRLRRLRESGFHDDGDLGYHECEICGQYVDRGELWLESGGIRYVAPAMILHYCEAHSYLPPHEFIQVLLDCDS